MKKQETTGIFVLLVVILLIVGAITQLREPPQKRLESWANANIVPVAAKIDAYTRTKIFNQEFSTRPISNIEEDMQATVSCEKLETTYRLFVKVSFVSKSEINLYAPYSSLYKPFDLYATDIFIGSALESAKVAYKTGNPPYPISEIQVALYKVHEYKVTTSPPTPYKAAETKVETREELICQATVVRDEILKATDWDHFSKYCHENPAFFFGQVCRDVQRPGIKR